MTVDRQRGCLIGLAVGDALGAAVEFKPPGSFELVTGYRAGGPHGLDPSEWTDEPIDGAICGQFAGAYRGELGIPQEWLDGLAKKEMIQRGRTS